MDRSIDLLTVDIESLALRNVVFTSYSGIYRVSINSFPDYKHLLQENYCTWNTKHVFFFRNVARLFFATH